MAGPAGENDDDYMCDSFLNTETNKDVRPGLIMTRKQQRLHDQKNKKMKCSSLNKTVGIKALEELRRQEGLKKAIDSKNKGFGMMQKMGYKPGSGIGKHNSGRSEPLGIVIKADRKGLGRDAALMEINGLKRSLLLERLRPAGPSIDEYRVRMAQKNAEKLDLLDLLSCQRACHRMDFENGIQEPSEKYFWPKNPFEGIDVQTAEEIEVTEKSDEDNMTITEQFKILNFYLRRAYNYCNYCGIVYDDQKDLQECPGPDRQDH